jgi:hypothetical protein
MRNSSPTVGFFMQLLAVLLCGSLLASAQGGNSFTRVRYSGGSVASKVDPKDWNNKLTVTPDAITLDFKDGQHLTIPPKSVTSLSYGQEAHRRVGTMIALAVLVAPVALFGLFHKTRLHYIGVQYNTPDGKNAGILLQGDKDNYRAMLVALQGVSGAPVAVGDKDREFIPVGVTTQVAKGDTPSSGKPELKDASMSSTPAAATADATGTVAVTSTPDGADVYVDGQFYGNAPATLKLKPGKHSIGVKMTAYKDWSREIATDAGSDARLSAGLEKVE